MDKVRCRPKGFAYVTFSSNEEAGKALLELNGQVLAPFPLLHLAAVNSIFRISQISLKKPRPFTIMFFQTYSFLPLGGNKFD